MTKKKEETKTTEETKETTEKVEVKEKIKETKKVSEEKTEDTKEEPKKEVSKEKTDVTNEEAKEEKKEVAPVKEENAKAKKEETKELSVEKETKNKEKKDSNQTSMVDTEKYLNTGAHIGTKFKSGDMKKYIYKVRKDGLNVLDVQTLDKRLNFASKFLSQFNGKEIIIVSRKVYGQTPVKVFAETIDAKAIIGRFVPGTFTNPESNHFCEPKVVVVTDPEVDSQAILEATKMRVPVVALASTNNELKNIDIAVPINNKGKKSIALAYWAIAKEILKLRDNVELSKSIEDFEYKMKEDAKKKPFQRRPRFGTAGRGGFRSGGQNRSDQGGRGRRY